MLKKERSSGETCNADEITNVQPNNSRFSDAEKPMRADAKQNRELILQAANKIFAEKGLSVPIGEIAHQAGVGIGTVYRHFQSKEALFDAVNISYKQKLTEEAILLINHTDPSKAFFDFFSLIMEYGFTNMAVRDAFRIGIFRVRTANSGVLLEFQSACADLLTRAQQAKAVREDIDIKDLITLMTGILLSIEQRKSTSDSNRFNRLVSVVRDGLRYRE